MNNIIYLQFDGVDSFAWITEIENKQHSMFKVLFKNGYENIFFTDVESGQWMEEDLGFTILAKEIGTQIKSLIKNTVHVPKALIWHKQEIDDILISFGFVHFRKENFKMYEIYNANRKYMYTLVEMDNEEWQILGNNTLDIKSINPVFLEYIIQILPLYWADAR